MLYQKFSLRNIDGLIQSTRNSIANNNVFISDNISTRFQDISFGIVERRNVLWVEVSVFFFNIPLLRVLSIDNYKFAMILHSRYWLPFELFGKKYVGFNIFNYINKYLNRYRTIQPNVVYRIVCLTTTLIVRQLWMECNFDQLIRLRYHRVQDKMTFFLNLFVLYALLL